MDADSERRTYLSYQPRDFLFYASSLAITAAVTWCAYPYAWVRGAIFACLAYLAIVFLWKRGGELDRQAPWLLLRAALGYPWRIARKLWFVRASLAPLLVFFAIGVAAEQVLARRLAPDAFWLRPFPYVTCFCIVFGEITVFRTVIFVAHLRRAGHVRSVLEESNWRRELKGLGTRQHVLHAYLTGLLAHACALTTVMVFWRLTAPTIVREAVMLALWIGWLAVRGLRFLRAHRIGFSAHNWYTATLRLSLDVPEDVMTGLAKTHEEDHKSRVGFTVFHGHHHDAIPSAVMAAIGTGFVEAVDRDIWLGTFLASTSATLVINVYLSWIDMLLHQYIPGVYPYSSAIVDYQIHHVAHHYGSLRPFGLDGLPSYKADIADGYSPDNAKVRWFIATLARYERAPDAEAIDKFVHLDVDARLREGMYVGYEDTASVKLPR